MVQRHQQKATCFPSLCSAIPQELASCSSIFSYDSKVFSGVGPISHLNMPCPGVENNSFSLCLFVKSSKSFPQAPKGPDLTSRGPDCVTCPDQSDVVLQVLTSTSHRQKEWSCLCELRPTRAHPLKGRTVGKRQNLNRVGVLLSRSLGEWQLVRQQRVSARRVMAALSDLQQPCVESKAWHGTSLVVQWLRLCTPNARGLDLIPGEGTRSYML